MALSLEPPSSPDSGPARAILPRLHKAIFDIALPKTASARTCTVPLTILQTIWKLVDELVHNPDPQPLDPHVTELALKLDTLTDKIDAITALHHETSPPLSYAEAAKATPPSSPDHPTSLEADLFSHTAPIDSSVISKLPLSHAATLKHVEDQARQLLIDTLPGRAPTNFNLAQLSEDILVQKGNSALEMMTEYLEEIGHFIGARILPNGGLILEADNEALVQWILETTVRSELFEQKFDGDWVTVRDRTYTVVLDFVPVAHEAGDKLEIKKMEEISNCSIAATRWLKSPEKRTLGQSTAALMVKAYSRESANALILSGTVIRGKRVFTRRLEKSTGIASIREQSYRFFPDPTLPWTWKQKPPSPRRSRQNRPTSPSPPHLAS